VHVASQTATVQAEIIKAEIGGPAADCNDLYRPSFFSLPLPPDFQEQAAMAATRYQNRERAALKLAFLKALCVGHSAYKAAKITGVNRTTLYARRSTDTEFDVRWQAAAQGAAVIPDDPLEADAQRRAVAGVEKPVYRAGKLEDQMCAFTGERIKGESPDRVDALVWAVSHLMLAPTSRPKIRSL
jgi:hypothetical protein